MGRVSASARPESHARRLRRMQPMPVAPPQLRQPVTVARQRRLPVRPWMPQPDDRRAPDPRQHPFAALRCQAQSGHAAESSVVFVDVGQHHREHAVGRRRVQFEEQATAGGDPAHDTEQGAVHLVVPQAVGQRGHQLGLEGPLLLGGGVRYGLLPGDQAIGGPPHADVVGEACGLAADGGHAVAVVGAPGHTSPRAPPRHGRVEVAYLLSWKPHPARELARALRSLGKPGPSAGACRRTRQLPPS